MVAQVKQAQIKVKGKGRKKKGDKQKASRRQRYRAGCVGRIAVPAGNAYCPGEVGNNQMGLLDSINTMADAAVACP